jgi:hypothetical protein
VAIAAEPPEDPFEWSAWARRSLSLLAGFRLRHPELPPAYVAVIEEFKTAVRAAIAAKPEDLIFDTKRLIESDVAELYEDAGPEVHALPERKRRNRRRRDEEE